MKNKKLLMLGLIPALLLTGCSRDDGLMTPDGGSISVDENKVLIYYFASPLHTDPEDAFAMDTVDYGSLLKKPAKDPVSEDPAFNVFKGWSSKVIAMSEDDYWDFKTDRIPEKILDLQKAFRLYGQWDYVSK